MKNIISIHQPNFFPWLPTLLKESSSSVHVILDHVEFSKNGWTNRCEYFSGKNKNYLTLPVKSSDTSLPINKVRTAGDIRSFLKIKRTLDSFSSRLPGKKILSQLSEEVFEKVKTIESLCDVNVFLHQRLREILGIKTKLIKSSDMFLPGDQKNSALIEQIFQFLEGSLYLTGSGGYQYLSTEFLKKCVKVTPNDLRISKEESNVLNFLLIHGNSSSERFEEIRNDFIRLGLSEL